MNEQAANIRIKKIVYDATLIVLQIDELKTKIENLKPTLKENFEKDKYQDSIEELEEKLDYLENKLDFLQEMKNISSYKLRS